MTDLCRKCALDIMCESWPITETGDSLMPEPPELVDGRCSVCNQDKLLLPGDLSGFWDHLFFKEALNTTLVKL
jgi:hypothetical protein